MESSIEGFFAAIVIVSVIIFGAIFIFGFHEAGRPDRERKAAEEKFQNRNDVVNAWEKSARPEETDFGWQMIRIAQSDVFKITGRNAHSDMDLFLITPTGSGYVHVAQSSKTPDLKLTGIQYNGQYSHTTTGELSSNAGNAMLGGMIAGTAGAQIGAAGKRTITTTTIDQEISSWNILEFEVVETGEQVAVSAVLDKPTYQSLFKNYLFRGEGPLDKPKETPRKADPAPTSNVVEPKPAPVKVQTPVEKKPEQTMAEPNAAIVMQLDSLHDNGLLTDEEYAEKMAKIGM